MRNELQAITDNYLNGSYINHSDSVSILSTFTLLAILITNFQRSYTCHTIILIMCTVLIDVDHSDHVRFLSSSLLLVD